LPSSVSTSELFIKVPEPQKFTLMKTLAHEFHIEGSSINELDGLRVSFDFGWGLIRVSNTTPNLMLRFEATNNLALQKIKELFRQELARILPHLTLPF